MGWYCAERMRVGRWRFRREGWCTVEGAASKVGRVSAGLVTLSGGIGAVRRRSNLPRVSNSGPVCRCSLPTSWSSAA